ncbi:MAG: hypothetical protein KDC38_05520, partial [Planctomycetes bacterium]|nr:hypothetical protein [Planctomycetota bacterium]
MRAVTRSRLLFLGVLGLICGLILLRGMVLWNFLFLRERVELRPEPAFRLLFDEFRFFGEDQSRAVVHVGRWGRFDGVKHGRELVYNWGDRVCEERFWDWGEPTGTWTAWGYHGETIDQKSFTGRTPPFEVTWIRGDFCGFPPRGGPGKPCPTPAPTRVQWRQTWSVVFFEQEDDRSGVRITDWEWRHAPDWTPRITLPMRGSA